MTLFMGKLSCVSYSPQRPLLLQLSPRRRLLPIDADDTFASTSIDGDVRDACVSARSIRL